MNSTCCTPTLRTCSHPFPSNTFSRRKLREIPERAHLRDFSELRGHISKRMLLCERLAAIRAKQALHAGGDDLDVSAAHLLPDLEDLRPVVRDVVDRRDVRNRLPASAGRHDAVSSSQADDRDDATKRRRQGWVWRNTTLCVFGARLSLNCRGISSGQTHFGSCQGSWCIGFEPSEAMPASI
eukprot:28657-Rhodomonas_salina.2